MHHVVAYGAASAAISVDLDTPALTDGIYPIQNGHIVFPRPQILLGAYALGAVLARARIVAPTFRQLGIPHIQPIDVSTNPSNNPPFMDLSGNPLKIRDNEEIAIQMSTTAVTASQNTALLLVQEQFTPAPKGDPYFLRVTGGTAAVANAWTVTALTFQDQLPAGTYAIVGGIGYSATMKAFRLQFDNQFQKPGGLGAVAEGSRPPVNQMHGGWGTWGLFRTNSLPRMEILCGATDGTQEFFLECVKVSSSL